MSVCVCGALFPNWTKDKKGILSRIYLVSIRSNAHGGSKKQHSVKQPFVYFSNASCNASFWIYWLLVVVEVGNENKARHFLPLVTDPN